MLLFWHIVGYIAALRLLLYMKHLGECRPMIVIVVVVGVLGMLQWDQILLRKEGASAESWPKTLFIHCGGKRIEMSSTALCGTQSDKVKGQFSRSADCTARLSLAGVCWANKMNVWNNTHHRCRIYCLSVVGPANPNKCATTVFQLPSLPPPHQLITWKSVDSVFDSGVSDALFSFLCLTEMLFPKKKCLANPKAL